MRLANLGLDFFDKFSFNIFPLVSFFSEKMLIEEISVMTMVMVLVGDILDRYL